MFLAIATVVLTMFGTFCLMLFLGIFFPKDVVGFIFKLLAPVVFCFGVYATFVGNSFYFLGYGLLLSMWFFQVGNELGE